MSIGQTIFSPVQAGGYIQDFFSNLAPPEPQPSVKFFTGFVQPGCRESDLFATAGFCLHTSFSCITRYNMPIPAQSVFAGQEMRSNTVLTSRIRQALHYTGTCNARTLFDARIKLT